MFDLHIDSTFVFFSDIKHVDRNDREENKICFVRKYQFWRKVFIFETNIVFSILFLRFQEVSLQNLLGYSSYQKGEVNKKQYCVKIGSNVSFGNYSPPKLT